MKASPATYGLLGMLATRSWTGYELTRQVSRSLRFVWPTSEGHLYREQKRLVTLGWAEVEKEPVGQRERNRYSITAAGRAALDTWQATAPEEPHLQVEGVLRVFHAEHASPEDLQRSMTATATSARAMLEELAGYAAEYLATGGPMEMLERGVGGDDDRRDFRGRTMYPERLPGVALSLDASTSLLEVVATFFAAEAERLEEGRPSSADTRATLQRVVDRARALEGDPGTDPARAS